MRTASLNDVPLLVAMMAEFYSDSPYALNPRRATDAFTALLADERLGHVWFIQSDSKDVGYVVVTLCHSMTFGGLVAIVDDFFIEQAFRGAGLACRPTVRPQLGWRRTIPWPGSRRSRSGSKPAFSCGLEPPMLTPLRRAGMIPTVVIAARLVTGERLHYHGDRVS